LPEDPHPKSEARNEIQDERKRLSKKLRELRLQEKEYDDGIEEIDKYQDLQRPSRRDNSAE
jgi:hypothetical protein